MTVWIVAYIVIALIIFVSIMLFFRVMSGPTIWTVICVVFWPAVLLIAAGYFVADFVIDRLSNIEKKGDRYI